MSLKIEQVEKKIQTVLDTFMDDKEMYHSKMLAKEGLPPNKLHYWRNKYPERVGKLLDELKELQEIKITSALLMAKGNPTGLIWYTKAKMGWVAQETLMKLELERAKANNPLNTISDLKLEISYDTIPSRTEEDINTLIEEVNNEK